MGSGKTVWPCLLDAPGGTITPSFSYISVTDPAAVFCLRINKVEKTEFKYCSGVSQSVSQSLNLVCKLHERDRISFADKTF